MYYVIFFMALTLFALSHFYVNPILLYFSILLVSSIYVLLLVQSRRVVEVIFITLVLSLFYSIFDIITGSNDILTWDLKAMENVASNILLKGRLPPADTSDPLLRLEYVSYPTAFTLLAISSYVTSLTIDQLMKLPILTLPLYIIVIYVIGTIFNKFRRDDWDVSRLLGVVLIVNIFLITFLIPFIYQNFGRTLMLLTMMILFRLATHSERQSISIQATLLVITLLSTALIMSHSESSIAFVIFVASLSISVFINKSIANQFQILRMVAIVVIVFMLYNLWLSRLFGESLLKMMLLTLSWAFQEGEVSKALARYTPYDYSFTDMALLSLGALSVISVLAFNLLLIMKDVTRRKSRVPLTLFPLTVAGLLFTMLVVFSPYKSDISMKFIYLLSAVIALFLYEKNSQYKTETKQGIHKSIVIATLVVIALSLSMTGIMVLKGTTKTYAINDIIYINSLYSQLNAFSDIMLNPLKNINTLIIIDEPTLPYFVIRDYIAPRINVNYIIIPIEPKELSYTITQINGIQLPRFILSQKQATLPNIWEIDNLGIICGAGDFKNLGKNSIVILNTGTLIFSIS
ncbi:MAG: hypothetical protein QXL22_04920 [Candidatus Nezhaarchaeales archaeon]